SFRRYLVTGPQGTLAIDKDAPTRWWVQPPDWPRNGFFAQRFRRLRDAVAYAQGRVEPVDTFPDPEMPVFMRRIAFKNQPTNRPRP
ncbi:MAG TPA: hypothetical protein VL147_16270, partial [Devosia sp.]|nr:hypothetical protein [Devosia sp.]